MSLIFCPECGHEVSANAAACPNCGLPIKPATVVEKRVAAPPPVVRESMPPWAIALLVGLGLGVIILGIVLFSSSNDNENFNVAVNTKGRSTSPSSIDRTTVSDSRPATSVPVSEPPSTSMPATTTTVPSTSVDPPAVTPDRGEVIVKAKVSNERGTIQPARGAKFYLLDKDVESILSEARVQPIEGNSLAGSLGLAAVFPDRYRDFQRAAQRAIAEHVKYSGSTDSSGTAALGKAVKPDSYYLFSVMRMGDGFAFWSSPVSVVPGENILDLTPQTVTIVDNTGD